MLAGRLGKSGGIAVLVAYAEILPLTLLYASAGLSSSFFFRYTLDKQQSQRNDDWDKHQHIQPEPAENMHHLPR
ncbi:hypothetical protein D3C78_1823580 [compost metagenome]